MTINHNDRIALTRQIFEQAVVPNLPPGEGAVLMLYAMGKAGRLTYIGNGSRDSMRRTLTELLAKWQREANQPSQTKGLFDVLAERYRQVDVEGHTEAHDDTHQADELTNAAAAYCLLATGNHVDAMRLWPWEMIDFKDHGPRRNLVIAGALMLADLERRDRIPERAAGRG